MGREGRMRKKSASAADEPTANASLAQMEKSGALDAIPDSLPVIEKLSSMDNGERHVACQSIAHLSDEHTALLERHNVVSLVLGLVFDPIPEIRIAACGALRNLIINGASIGPFASTMCNAIKTLFGQVVAQLPTKTDELGPVLAEELLQLAIVACEADASIADSLISDAQLLHLLTQCMSIVRELIPPCLKLVLLLTDDFSASLPAEFVAGIELMAQNDAESVLNRALCIGIMLNLQGMQGMQFLSLPFCSQLLMSVPSTADETVLEACAMLLEFVSNILSTLDLHQINHPFFSLLLQTFVQFVTATSQFSLKGQVNLLSRFSLVISTIASSISLPAAMLQQMVAPLLRCLMVLAKNERELDGVADALADGLQALWMMVREVDASVLLTLQLTMVDVQFILTLLSDAQHSSTATKCAGFGVLAAIAKIPHSHQDNAHILQAMVGRTGPQEPSLLVWAEALNALFDVYADEQYDAVLQPAMGHFVQIFGLLAQRLTALKKARRGGAGSKAEALQNAGVASEDLELDRDEVERIEEAAENLGAFIEYKRGTMGL